MFEDGGDAPRGRMGEHSRFRRVWGRSAERAMAPDGSAYSVVHEDGLGGLFQVMGFGLVPLASPPGQIDLVARLRSTGVELAFLNVPPGAEAPYAMRHRRNEVVYVVAGGRGQFVVDGEAVEVAAGSVLRVRPDAVRAWRNVSSDDLLLIIIQGRAGSLRPAKRSDAVGLARRVPWWRYPWPRPATILESRVLPQVTPGQPARTRFFGRFVKPLRGLTDRPRESSGTRLGASRISNGPRP